VVAGPGWSLSVGRGGSSRGRLERSLSVSVGGQEPAWPGSPPLFQEAAARRVGGGGPLRSRRPQGHSWRRSRPENRTRKQEANQEAKTRPNTAEGQSKAGGPGGASPAGWSVGAGPHKAMAKRSLSALFADRDRPIA